ncbi:MAG: 23S rRNA (guanosine(2251)-2'-O)-methyltransferase RlmB [Clostridia bacterium]|nr:23S rRNA (guanosine(2251)-2'-O)-methyltransferase RlmB [Clostridia bacterium]
MKIEGKNPVSELIKSGKNIEKIFILDGAADKGSGKELFVQIKSSGASYVFLDKNAMKRISETGNHQGFIAVAGDYQYTPLNILLQRADSCKNPLIAVLDDIVDPHNLGSIIRVCECAGVNGIILPERRSAQVNETVIKVSCGAAFCIDIARVVNINSAINELKDNGYWVYGADSGGESMYGAGFGGKTALVIGGEGEGIKRLVRENCDKIVAIPMAGKINSLNAAAACAVLVYEIKRQSGFFGGQIE